MKKLAIITLLISYVGFSQNKAQLEDQSYFEKAVELIYEDENEDALKMFNQFIIEFPNSELIPRAKFNIAFLNRKIGNIDESIASFKEILKSNYNETDAYGGIMEQYTLYKNRSAKHLAEMHLEKQDFTQAKKYIVMFDKQYPYKHFCGNELTANEIYTAVAYAKLYNGLGKIEKAIKKLLPYMFENGLASNTEAVTTLDTLLTNTYTTEQLKKMTAEAINSLTVLPSKEEAHIRFMDTKISFYDYSLYSMNNENLDWNLKLQKEEKYKTVLRTHPIFSKYIN